MRITPLKIMLKTKIVKDFLQSEKYKKAVKKQGYNNIEEFFSKKYSDYKENGEDWGFDKINTEILLYNIKCDMEAIL